MCKQEWAVCPLFSFMEKEEMAKKNVKNIVEESLEIFLKENQMELWNVEFVKESRDWFLRVFIDKIDKEHGSVSLEECEKTSRYLSEILDDIDLLEQNYFLEVSSPGLERELITDRHFEKFVGSPIEIKLYKALDGKKKLSGIIKGVTEDEVELFHISDDGETIKKEAYTVRKSEIAKANLMFFM